MYLLLADLKGKFQQCATFSTFLLIFTHFHRFILPATSVGFVGFRGILEFFELVVKAILHYKILKQKTQKHTHFGEIYI